MHTHMYRNTNHLQQKMQQQERIKQYQSSSPLQFVCQRTAHRQCDNVANILSNTYYLLYPEQGI